MLYNRIKYDFFHFLTLIFSACFWLFMVQFFWGSKSPESRLFCFWLLGSATVQVLVGLRMITRRRFEENQKLEEKLNDNKNT